MANQFVVQSGKTVCASNALKVAASLASTSTKTAKVTGIDVSFDGVDSTKTPILVELVRTTGAPSTSGAAFTPVLEGGDASATASCTARINDTADGASPTVIRAWLVSPTGGLSYQWPLGREPSLKVSDFIEVRVTTVSASGTPNYDVTLAFEE